MVCIIACIGGNVTHALVYFDEEKSSAVVPISKVSCENLEKGNECDVVWMNGSIVQFSWWQVANAVICTYGFYIIDSGSKCYCQQQQNIFEADNESDDEHLFPMPHL